MNEQVAQLSARKKKIQSELIATRLKLNEIETELNDKKEQSQQTLDLENSLLESSSLSLEILAELSEVDAKIAENQSKCQCCLLNAADNLVTDETAETVESNSPLLLSGQETSQMSENSDMSSSDDESQASAHVNLTQQAPSKSGIYTQQVIQQTINDVYELLDCEDFNEDAFSNNENLTSDQLLEVLSNPEPWHAMNEAKRQMYCRISGWLVHNKKKMEEIKADKSVSISTSKRSLHKKNLASLKNVDKKSSALASSRKRKSCVELINPCLIRHGVQKLMCKWGMSNAKLAEHLNIPYDELVELFENPQPWYKLSGRKRDLYRFMKDWYEMRVKEIKEDLAAEVNDTNDSLNAGRVEKKLVQWLDEIGVPQEYFAKEVLYITKQRFDELMLLPVALNESDREILHCCTKWTHANLEAVSKLQKEHAEFVRNAQVVETALGRNADGSLNTVVVATLFMKWLVDIGVRLEFFVEKVLFITKQRFMELVVVPAAWEELSESDRKIFQLCYDWMRVNREVVLLVQQDHDKHRENQWWRYGDDWSI
jgi:hypothetical protein